MMSCMVSCWGGFGDDDDDDDTVGIGRVGLVMVGAGALGCHSESIMMLFGICCKSSSVLMW